MGAKNGVRSLIIAGLILNMSLALFGLIVCMALVTSFRLVCLSWNRGWLGWSGRMHSSFSSCWGMVWLVL